MQGRAHEDEGEKHEIRRTCETPQQQQPDPHENEIGKECVEGKVRNEQRGGALACASCEYSLPVDFEKPVECRATEAENGRGPRHGGQRLPYRRELRIPGRARKRIVELTQRRGGSEASGHCRPRDGR
jgi:hypothetical protein